MASTDEGRTVKGASSRFDLSEVSVKRCTDYDEAEIEPNTNVFTTACLATAVPNTETRLLLIAAFLKEPSRAEVLAICAKGSTICAFLSAQLQRGISPKRHQSRKFTLNREMSAQIQVMA